MLGKKAQSVWLGAGLLVGLMGASPLRAQGLGRFSEWSAPVNLGPVINSEFSEGAPAISPNGLSLYFSSDRPGGFGENDLYIAQRATPEDPWGTPVNLGPAINTDSQERTPNLSPDGHWLYFGSNRPGGCGNEDLLVAYREDPTDDFAWYPAFNLGCIVNSLAFDAGPAYFADYETGRVQLFFTTNRDLGQTDVHVSALGEDHVYGPPERVLELSSPEVDGRPTIRYDGLEIIIQSMRPGGFGDFDLWMAARDTTQEAWRIPVNLGPMINSDAADNGPSLSLDGTTLYFSSARDGGYGSGDLYMATRTMIRE